jgi:hypothetical protein
LKGCAAELTGTASGQRYKSHRSFCVSGDIYFALQIEVKLTLMIAVGHFEMDGRGQNADGSEQR